MLHAWPGLRELTDGEFLGASTWLNALTRRANWIYGQAHAIQYLQRQTWSWYSPATVWAGETKYRSEHPTLVFSARINLGESGAAYLEYVNSSGNWTTIASDGNAGDRWFNGVENNEFDCSGLDLPSDGILRLRFYVGGGECTLVARAWMKGEVGLTAWPGSVPLFADGVGNEPTASDFNALKQMSEYLYDRAKQPAYGSIVGTVNHEQPGAYEPLFRWSFVYDGRKALHYDLSTWGMEAGDLVRIFLNEEKYPVTGYNRLNGGNPLADFVADGNYSGDIDLSVYGLTVGERYQIELGIYPDGPFVGINTIYIHDLDSETRTHVPATFAHGDRLAAAPLNVIAGSLSDCYPDASRESPLWMIHHLQPYQLLRPAPPGDPDIGYSAYMRGVHHYRVRLTHRWRYLRYRSQGAVPLMNADGSLSYRLPDTDGEASVIDLDKITWLSYGMEYEIQDENENWIMCAYEDYDA